MISLSSIKINKDNPRYIKKEKVDKLKKSIQLLPQMMDLRPIIVDENNVILGGNMRYLGLLELGYKEVPNEWIKKTNELSEDQKKEFIIKDNVGFGDWDWEILANSWDSEDLADWGLDLPDTFIKENNEVIEDEFEIPEEIKTDIVLGDLFEFIKNGEVLHRLMCGDSTCRDTVAKLMNGEKADMVFTDPPYGANMRIENDRKNEFKKVFSDFISILPCEDNIYVCSDWRCVGFFINEIEKNNYEIYNLVIWVKNLFGQGKLYHTKHEEIIFCGKGNYRKDKINDDVNVWEADSVRNFGGSKNAQEAVGHPTQKPVEICSRAINNSSILAEIVFDGFLGSGSTMVASHQLKRKCYGMELDPKYCDVIVNRMVRLDNSLKIKRNGVDETGKWLLGVEKDS